MEFVMCFMCSLATLSSILSIVAVCVLGQYFKELKQDMKGKK